MLSRDQACVFSVDADTELTYNVSMADNKMTESEEIDMILYGKIIDRTGWVYTTESEEYEMFSEEE
jgi:hypothetical protein